MNKDEEIIDVFKDSNNVCHINIKSDYVPKFKQPCNKIEIEVYKRFKEINRDYLEILKFKNKFKELQIQKSIKEIMEEK